MKKLTILAASLVIATSAVAEPKHNHGHGHRHSDIIAPVVIGTIIGYGISQASKANDNPPVQIIHQPPVQIIHQPPVQIVNQTPEIIPLHRPAQPVYDKRVQYDPYCSCYKQVWVQTGWR